MYPKYCQSCKKRCPSIKSETLSLKTMNNELVFLLGLLLFNGTLEKKRFVVPCEQIDIKNTWSS